MASTRQTGQIQVVKADNKEEASSPPAHPGRRLRRPFSSYLSGKRRPEQKEWATNDKGGAMPDFGEMADKAKDFAGEHDKQSDEALDKAADFASDKTGNKYDSQIQSGEDKAENYLGVEDQDKDQQNQSSN